MGEQSIVEVWDAVRAGRSVLVRGEVPEPPAHWTAIEVSCDAPPNTAGPITEAFHRVLGAVGDAQPAAMAWRSGPSARALGEGEPPSPEAALVEAGNRLARESSEPSVLVFRSVQRADTAALTGLAEILAHPGWLALPMVLEVKDGESLPQLEQVVRAAGGAVIELRPPAEPPGPTWDWHAVPGDVLQVLRAGAAVGPVFEAEVIARLLDQPPLRVLDRLQVAADAGAPLMDRGAGRLSLPAELAAALRASMLPSLLAAWHTRLAELLRSPEAAKPRPTAPSEQTVASKGPGPAAAGKMERPQVASHAAETAETALGREPMRQATTTRSQNRDEARAAAHFAEAGKGEAAAESYLAAARRLSDQGDWRRARLMVERALPLVEQIAARARRAELTARAHLTTARIQWQASGRAQGSSLQDALRSLDAAEAALPDEVSAGLLAELAATRAGVCYDLGDPSALQGALTALVDASRALLDAGETLEAARLLNDQAAIHLRLDDPAQAIGLLNRSGELFERLRRGQGQKPVAEEELAETYHLLARVPLHARTQPGREAEAFQRALGHAEMAEGILSERADTRRLGRLWETMARLQLAQGDLEAAAARLSQATQLQQRLGDAIGLARSAAAQAELLARSGRPEEAISALATSIALNYQKGSPMGLAFNRSALVQLQTGLGPRAAEMQPGLRELEQRLTAAEGVVGRGAVPVG